jgi:hypothetical protein
MWRQYNSLKCEELQSVTSQKTQHIQQHLCHNLRIHKTETVSSAIKVQWCHGLLFEHVVHSWLIPTFMASLSFSVRVSPSATEKLASYWTSTVESVSKVARPSRNRWPYCFIRVVVYWKLCSGDTLKTFHVLPIRSTNKNMLNYLFVQITESICHAVYFRKQ